MDTVRIGLILRALRRRLNLRQSDVAAMAGVSQSEVSLIERGHADRVPLATLQRVATALGARVEFDVRWRGGSLDRLLDARHAPLVGATAAELRDCGWEVAIEVTYSRYRESGSFDVLGWREDARTLLVVEVKGDLTSAEGTLRKHDEKVRLAPAVARERFGWRPLVVGRLLVLRDTTTTRRRLGEHDYLMRSALPATNREVRSWLRHPGGPMSGRLLLRVPAAVSLPGPDRVRVRRKAA
jgi:transcriptional regulator with XRE-family HTH domain